MRTRRNTIHPTSRHASPARRNPLALDSREPTWRNASPDDITRTPPRGGDAHDARGACADCMRDFPGARDVQDGDVDAGAGDDPRGWAMEAFGGPASVRSASAGRKKVAGA